MASIKDPCPICSQDRAGQPCRNRLCSGREGEVFIERIEAITLFVDPIQEIAHRYKYKQKHGWAQIFARLLLGHLETSWHPDDMDLIVANPSGPGLSHTGRVLKSAQIQDFLDVWPFDDADNPSLSKQQTTLQSANRPLHEKRQAARLHADALRLSRPEDIKGKKIVVYDDVCTTGLQLNAVARRLREWEAQSIRAIVLARQPWQ